MSHTPIHIGLAGTGFMGRVHSQAWARAQAHFDLPHAPVRHVVCGTKIATARTFARRWGWSHATADWHDLIADPNVQVIDVATPNSLHAEMSITAIEAGKAIVCEKPIGRNVWEARHMLSAAERHGAKAFVWFNYRQIPALILARQLIRDGRLGEIRRVRASYLQDWMNRESTITGWRMQPETAGGGAALDLMSHSVDLVRYLTGSEFMAVCATCCVLGQQGRMRPAGQTIDNAVAAIAELSCGAQVTLEASRCAAGHGNDNFIEINGERGAIRFCLPEFNHLEFWDDELPKSERGWRRLPTTGPAAPHGERYWPVDHPIGYAETFVSTAAEVCRALDGHPTPLLATFEDGLRSLEVVAAAIRSAEERRWINLLDARAHADLAEAEIEPLAERSALVCQVKPQASLQSISENDDAVACEVIVA